MKNLAVAFASFIGVLSLCACGTPPSDESGGPGQADPPSGGQGGAPVKDGDPDEIVTVPELGPRVLLFDPSMDMTLVQERIDQIANVQDSRDSEFGPGRYALLFEPGVYDLDVRAGYYTQVAGLGFRPGDVVINGGVESRQVRDTALSNFWRSAENLTVIPTDGSNTWAASQASPLRRIHVVGSLDLSEGGYTSGGFLADSKIDMVVRSGTQQQFFSRNTNWNQWSGGVWNMMFVGALNPPAGEWPTSPYTVIEETPLVREKPFLYIDGEGAYHVFVPAFTQDTVGTSWEQADTPGASIPIDSFYVAHEDVDSAASINAALATGKHLLITPGKYYLDEPIRITEPGTVALGLGFPSFIPQNGTEAMIVADVDDVVIAGMTFDAGPQESPTLLRVGEAESSANHSGAPTLLSDVFCRVGSSDPGVTSSCVTINSNDVVADHFWLWRADHGPSATEGRPGWGVNVSANGLIVNGANVTIYGLFNEHFQEYQTVWNGDGGRVYFYQCEMPYDPPDQQSWSHAGVDGYAAYKVAEGVTTHEAWGLGIYCTFQAAPVFAESAIEVPDVAGVKMHHMTTFWLSGLGGGIRNVINQSGAEAIEGNQQGIIDEYPLP